MNSHISSVREREVGLGYRRDDPYIILKPLSQLSILMLNIYIYIIPNLSAILHNTFPNKNIML